MRFNPGETPLPKNAAQEVGPQLVAPFTSMKWVFDDGASSADHVLEIQKEGVRHALYTHIVDSAVSQDGASLFLRNHTFDGTAWTLRQRWIDVATKRAVDVELGPPCATDYVEFSGSHLLTYGLPVGNTTTFCLVAKPGYEPRTLGVLHAAWRSFSRDEHVGRVAVHPDQPHVLAYAHPWRCDVQIVDQNTQTGQVVQLRKESNHEPPEPCVGFQTFDVPALWRRFPAP